MRAFYVFYTAAHNILILSAPNINTTPKCSALFSSIRFVVVVAVVVVIATKTATATTSSKQSTGPSNRDSSLSVCLIVKEDLEFSLSLAGEDGRAKVTFKLRYL